MLKTVGFPAILILIAFLIPIANAQAEAIILYPTDDSYTSFNDNYNTTHGNETQLKVAMTSIDYMIYVYRVWLKFDLSSIPKGATGFTAILELYTSHNGVPCHDGVPAIDTFEAYLCLNGSWSEEILNVCNAPCPFDDLFLDSETVKHEETWYSWIVTDGVENATARNETIITIVLTHPLDAWHEGAVWAKFNSKEAGTYIPRLTVTWTVIPEFPSFLLLPLFMIISLLYVITRKRFKP